SNIVDPDQVEIRSSQVGVAERPLRLGDAQANAPWGVVDRVVVSVPLQMLVVEHARAAAQAGLAVAEHIPSESEAAADVVIVAQRAILRHTGISAKALPARGVGEARRLCPSNVVLNAKNLYAASRLM